MTATDENKYTVETVAQILKGYKDMKRKAMQLEFEITHFAPIATGEDIIDAMTFGKAEGDSVDSVHNGNASDKTARIAVSYAESANSINMKYKNELEEDLRNINREMLRLEFYVSLLDEKHSKILSMLYLECLTLTNIAEKMKLSVDTIKNYRKTGIFKLVGMYNSIVR